ncbi:hypothetical protein D9M72_556560 [compost metagenome]
MARYLDGLLLLVPPADHAVPELQRIVRGVLYRVVAVAFRKTDVVDVVGRLLGARLVTLVDRFVLHHLVIAEHGTNKRRQHLLHRRAHVARNHFRAIGVGRHVLHHPVVIFHRPDAIDRQRVAIGLAIPDELADEVRQRLFCHRCHYTTFRSKNFQAASSAFARAKRFIISA